MSLQANLNRLLRPKSIAVVGGRQAVDVIRQCQRIDFDGAIWPVNPHRKDLCGVSCYRSIEDLPGAPDASFIGVPPAATIETIRSLSLRGSGGAVCYASGFAEHGEEGAALQQQLLEAAGEMALVGPNCHGFANLLDGIALWPDEMGCDRSNGGAAFIMQSGNLGINLTMQDRSTPISYVICVGNSANLTAAHYIDALLADPRVTAIGLHIEGLSHVESFSKAAIRALKQGIPVIALKAGRSQLGAQLTLSHTSSLAGEDQLYDSLFERLGVARCHSLEELLETTKLLSVTGPLPDGKIASMSCSGGEAALVADYAEQLELALPAMSSETTNALQAQLTDKVHISNPLDYHNYIWGDYEALKRCFSTVMANPYDCTMLVLDYPKSGVCDSAAWEITEKALVDASKETGKKAVLASTIPEDLPRIMRRRLIEAGVAPMQGLDHCLRALSAAVQIGTAQNEVAHTSPTLALEQLHSESVVWSEYDSKAALAKYGVRIPLSRLCRAADVASTADEVGYPVVLKAAGAELMHKSDTGGVRLNLASRAEVSNALESMAALSNQFLIEPMIQDTVAEMIVGIKRDPLFGFALVLGTGGTLVELLQDTVTLLLPARRSAISGALGRLKIGQLIRGFRGHGPGNWEATLDAIESIVAFAMANASTLDELDVNPLIILPQGHQPIAVDAVIKSAP